MDPAIKTEQFQHQRELYEEHRDKKFYALFWEMGLGKSKTILDVASHLFFQGKIKAVILLATNAVYKNWIEQEIPPHLAAPYVAITYPKKGSDRDKIKKLVFLDPDFQPDKLKILAISYDSLCTVHGLQFAMNFAKLYSTFIVADESTAIRKASSKRAEHAKLVRGYCQYAWICTGTPISEKPFDIHSQIEFICPEYWETFGMKSISAFKSSFAIYSLNKIGNRRFNVLEGYKNLDKLAKMIRPISSRLLKEDSGVSLPPKIYAIRTFEMTSEQRSLYNTLKYKFKAEFEEGLYLDAPKAIVRLARLQQIACGYVTAEKDVETLTAEDFVDTAIEDNDPLKSLKIIRKEKQMIDIVSPSENPRLQLLVSLLEEAEAHKSIVWCRYTRDVDLISCVLGDKCVRYDGKVSQKDRQIVINRFRDPLDEARVLVANTHAISQGVTLTIAKTMIYYSNDFSLERRLQSEDRNHRIGQDMPVLIIDIAAENSIDEKIIDSLKNKYDVAAQVTGDKLRDWIK